MTTSASAEARLWTRDRLLGRLAQGTEGEDGGPGGAERLLLVAGEAPAEVVG